MNLSTTDDTLLIKLCIANKNDNAFAKELIQRYGRLILQTITWTFKRLSQFDQNDVDDVFQEVFSSLFKNECRALVNFDSTRASLGTYLCTISKNTTVNACKKKRRNIDEFTDCIENDGLDPEMLMEQRECLDKIRSQLASFSPKEQLFFKLYFEEYMPPEDIAPILGVSIDTVYSKKAKILEKLKNNLLYTV